jgi:hypothetical protein
MDGPEFAARAKAGKSHIAAAALMHCSTNCLRVVGLMRESVAERLWNAFRADVEKYGVTRFTWLVEHNH